jgi:hypothetical protein
MGQDAAPDGARRKADFRERWHHVAQWKLLQSNGDHFGTQWIGLAAQRGLCCNGGVVAKRE